MTRDATDEQQRAIDSEAELLLVSAGPGTGKTFTSIKRAIRLARAGEKVLMTTFTISARQELTTRLDEAPDLEGQARSRIVVMTCGAVAWRTVREWAPQVRQMGYGETMARLRKLMAALGMARPAGSLSAADEQKMERRYYLEHLQGLMLLTANHIAIDDPDIPEDYQALYRAWHAGQKDDGVCDSTSIQSLACDLMQRGCPPSDLNGVTHVLADEAQDLSQVQYDMLRALVALGARNGRGRMTLVGDNEQGIYSWRGAIHGLMTPSAHDRARTDVVTLTQNWRSGRLVVKAALSVVNTIDGVNKVLVAGRKGESPIIRARRNIKDEASFAAERAEALRAGGQIPLHEMAIIGRTHRVLNDVFTALDRKKIPLCYAGNNFFERPEYRTLRAAVAFLAGQAPQVALADLAGVYLDKPIPAANLSSLRPGSGLTKREMIEEALKGLKGAQAETLRRAMIVAVEREALGGPFVDRFRALVGGLDLRAAFKKRSTARFLGHTLGDLIWMAEDYQDYGSYLAGLSEREATQQGQRPLPGHVFIGTPFAVKGLEFHSVVVVGVNEGIFPSPYAEESETDYRYDVKRSGGLDEEKRMLFVAMTRAKEFLALTYSRHRAGGPGGVAAEMQPSHLLALSGLKMPL